MNSEARVSYYIDKYGMFHKILRRVETNNTPRLLLSKQVQPKPCSTWLRLIVMFWNTRVLKAALRFGVAAIIMNQYERLGFAVFILCFAV